MGGDTAFRDRLLTSRDTFQYDHPLLHELVRLDIKNVRARKPMLRDEDRLLVTLNVRKKCGGLTLESGDEFGARKMIL